MDERYARQVILKQIGRAGQEKLAASSVLIIGLGALGSVASNILARIGVGRIALVDRDYVELSNLHRQALFDERDIGLPKAVAAKNELQKINSLVTIKEFVTDFNSANAEELVKDVNLILDGTDNLETRFLINDVAVKLGVPWVYASCISTLGMTFNIVPGKTPCLRCVMPSLPPTGSLDTCETAGILSTAPAVIASIQSTEAIKILLGKEFSKKLCVVNVWTNRTDFLNIRPDKNCRTCQKRDFEFLEGRYASKIHRLCGLNTFQIRTPTGPIDLKGLARKLRGVGKVSHNPYILHFQIGQKMLSIFRDGRVIAKGVKDEKEAKSLCARFMG
jgi:adenylyltransferase/sulfurtransferase